VGDVTLRVSMWAM